MSQEQTMSHEHKVREYYDVAVHCYQSIMGYTWHHGDPEAEARGASYLEAAQVLEEKMVALSGLKAGGWALDFGSGVGGATLYMAKVAKASFVGLSNNEGLSQRARDRAAELGQAGQVSFLTVGDTDYKRLPFPDRAFDAVFFIESVCHLPDKPAFFREAFRILKPGCRLVALDWLQRPFGENTTEEQIRKYMRPVEEYICLAEHGTVGSYRKMMQDAGFDVSVARDLFEGVKCFGSTPPEERPLWLNYAGPDAERFRGHKRVLDAAREAGVFTVGMFAGTRPAAA